jgi:hypothetical protein
MCAAGEFVDVGWIAHHDVVKQNRNADDHPAGDDAADQAAPNADLERLSDAAGLIGGNNAAECGCRDGCYYKPSGHGIDARMRIAQVSEDRCAPEVAEKDFACPHGAD